MLDTSNFQFSKFDEKKFKIAILNSNQNLNSFADSLKISREALRRRVKSGEFSKSEIVVLKRYLEKKSQTVFYLAYKSHYATVCLTK